MDVMIIRSNRQELRIRFASGPFAWSIVVFDYPEFRGRPLRAPDLPVPGQAPFELSRFFGVDNPRVFQRAESEFLLTALDRAHEFSPHKFIVVPIRRPYFADFLLEDGEIIRIAQPGGQFIDFVD